MQVSGQMIGVFPMRILPCLIWILILVALLPAQHDRCLEELAEGARALATGDYELAAFRLRAAREAAHEMPLGTIRTNLEKRIHKLMRKADPLDAACVRALTKAAKGLIRMAESYIRAKRYATAKGILLLASRLDKQLTKEPLKRVEALLEARDLTSLPAEDETKPRPSGKGKTANATFSDLEFGGGAFKGGLQNMGRGTWRPLGKNGLVSPRLVDGQTHMIVSRTRIAGDAVIKLEALIGRENGIAGFFVGFKDSGQDSLLVEVAQRGNWRWNRVHAVKWGEGFKAEELQSKPYQVKAQEKAGWVSIAIEIKGQQVRVNFGTGPAIRLDLPGKDLTGRFGIYISGNWGNRDPIVYRDLEIEPRPSAAKTP